MSIHFFIIALLTGIAAAVISVTMIDLLANEPILNWWFRLGHKVGIYVPDGMGAREFERWFYKPIWGCCKCFAGQLALWIYLFGHISGNSPEDWQEHGWFRLPGYSLLAHILAVCIAITSAFILSHFINQIKDKQ